MAKLLIIGASRGVGLEAVKLGLQAGHAVRAMARSAERIDIDDPGLEPVAADALDAAAVEAALGGVDAVIQTLGVRKTAGTILRPVTLFSRATEVLVAAMERAGVRRLVAVTGFGTGDSATKVSRLEAIPQRLVLGRIYDDKAAQEAIIRASGLDWTIVRPVILTPGPRTGRYKVMIEPAAWRNGLIARADVADFLIAQVDDTTCLHRAPVIAY